MRISAKRRSEMGELIDKMKGRIKQVTGKVTNDRSLEREGKADEIKGRVKGAAEEAKHSLRESTRREPRPGE
jgi:uncharacterized protein YjbJ (UPF0337 family)